MGNWDWDLWDFLKGLFWIVVVVAGIVLMFGWNILWAIVLLPIPFSLPALFSLLEPENSYRSQLRVRYRKLNYYVSVFVLSYLFISKSGDLVGISPHDLLTGVEISILWVFLINLVLAVVWFLGIRIVCTRNLENVERKASLYLTSVTVVICLLSLTGILVSVLKI